MNPLAVLQIERLLLSFKPRRELQPSFRINNLSSPNAAKFQYIISQKSCVFVHSCVPYMLLSPLSAQAER